MLSERIGDKRDVCGLVQGAVAEGKGGSPDKAMTALCLTNVPGLLGPDKEEFAVKLPMPLPFSPFERREHPPLRGDARERFHFPDGADGPGHWISFRESLYL